jgi:hypothetical protein
MPYVIKMKPHQKPKFPLGEFYITKAAHELLTQEDVEVALARHVIGDWGDVSDDDRNQNELSVTDRYRLFSVYHSAGGIKFWIITEADRSVTTVLLPDDY